MWGTGGRQYLHTEWMMTKNKKTIFPISKVFNVDLLTNTLIFFKVIGTAPPLPIPNPMYSTPSCTTQLPHHLPEKKTKR